METLDAVVVGAGPNGLAAAITLAQAGLQVVLYEGADTVGGGARTEELTLPGFRHDPCSAVHPLGAGSPVLRSWPLERHGLSWIQPELALAHPFPDGTAATLARSVAETAASLGIDERAYVLLLRPFLDRWDELAPDVLRAPLDGLPRHPLLLARFGLTGLVPADALASYFRGERARGLLAGLAAHVTAPLTSLATGAVALVFALAAHEVGWPTPRGGTQALSDAMASLLTSLGGTIKTGHAVRHLSELPPARAYLFDTSPEQLAAIAGSRLPPRYAAVLRRYQHGPAVFKIDYALSGPVPWTAGACRRAGTVHLGPSLADIGAALRSVHRGSAPGRPFLITAQPSVSDPGRAPAGSHVFWAYCQVPNGWPRDHTAAIEAQIERFAPGFRDLILARAVTPPAGVEARNPNNVGGDIAAGRCDQLRLLFRPTFAPVPYATPDRSIFLCSAATPPGPGVHGMCGYHAAATALRRVFGRLGPPSLGPPSPGAAQSGAAQSGAAQSGATRLAAARRGTGPVRTTPGHVMPWFAAPDYWFARLAFQRGLAVIYLIAFVAAARQFRPLLGERGLLPIPAYTAGLPFRRAPSVFSLHYSDRFFALLTGGGAVLAAALAAGLGDLVPLWASMLLWAVPWMLQVSLVNVGQTWYGFGWETLLAESGFLAIVMGNARTAPPVLVLWLVRWLIFRLEFGAGLIKMRGDRCWRDLTCLRYHHETQPMPGPLSWFFHHLPDPLHRAEALANHVAQLVVPFALFAPQPVASVAAAAIIVTQLWLVLSGNFAWLNWLTIVLAVSAVDDSAARRVLPLPAAPRLAAPPGWYEGIVLAVTAAVVMLSYRPARNLLSRRQVMNSSFDPLRLVNTYGAFGSVTRRRHEVIIEGTSDTKVTPGTHWREYEFKGKPGDPRRRPPQVAPYHLRLDWLMWFAALSSRYAQPWLVPLLYRLLAGDPGVLPLLRSNPFPGTPPVFVRARLFRYRYTTWRELRETGAWWQRSPVREYVPPVTLRPPDRVT